MINRLTILGNTGTVRMDDYRKFDSGARKFTFSVACNEKYKGKDGEMQEHTTWHRVECWNNTADFCNKYMDTGSLVYVSGPYIMQSFEKDGETKTRYILKARDIKILKSSKFGSERDVINDLDDEDIPF